MLIRFGVKPLTSDTLWGYEFALLEITQRAQRDVIFARNLRDRFAILKMVLHLQSSFRAWIRLPLSWRLSRDKSRPIGFGLTTTLLPPLS